jgi:hypothetical protein
MTVQHADAVQALKDSGENVILVKLINSDTGHGVLV